MSRFAALIAVVAITAAVRDWLFLRAVERYLDRGASHREVVAFAKAVRPRRAPPERDGGPRISPGASVVRAGYAGSGMDQMPRPCVAL